VPRKHAIPPIEGERWNRANLIVLVLVLVLEFTRSFDDSKFEDEDENEDEDEDGRGSPSHLKYLITASVRLWT
jgi:hypothetical protein